LIIFKGVLQEIKLTLCGVFES